VVRARQLLLRRYLLVVSYYLFVLFFSLCMNSRERSLKNALILIERRPTTPMLVDAGRSLPAADAVCLMRGTPGKPKRLPGTVSRKFHEKLMKDL